MRAADLDDLAALMLDAASGAAGAGERLLVETSAAFHPDRAAAFALAEAAGGALLAEATARLKTEQLANAPQAAARIREDGGDVASARDVVRLACVMPKALSWRPLAPGVRYLKLAVADARLVRIAGGAGLPVHDHGGEERTLVLAGAYRDEERVYEPGDMALADVGEAHAPRALAGPDCVCLVVAQGRMRFRGVIERIAARLLWD